MPLVRRYIGICVVGCPMLLQVSLYYKGYIDDCSHTHLVEIVILVSMHDHSRNAFTLLESLNYGHTRKGGDNVC